MAVQVKVPTILRAHTEGEPVVTGNGGTVREVLADLDGRFPGLLARVAGEDGAIHRFVNVYVNDEDVRYLGALETDVRDGDVVSILPAVAGGWSPRHPGLLNPGCPPGRSRKGRGVMETRAGRIAISLALIVAAGCGQSASHRSGAPAGAGLEEDIAGRLGDLPLTFIENHGQADPRAAYYLQGSEASVFFTTRGLRVGLPDRGGTAQRWNLGLDFVGARSTAPQGLGKTPSVVSYFKGVPEDWHTAIPTFSRVAYRDLWPGIDLIYSGTGSRLKYSFLVDPGADPSRIAFRWRGATELAVDDRGRLMVSTPVRTVTDQAPVSYQVEEGRRVDVATSFALEGNVVGFGVEGYRPRLPLVIDPAVLLYAGFIGGAGDDYPGDVAVDELGSAYIAGSTESTETTFPETVGPDLSHNGGSDTFVAKVVPSGTSLAYAGFIGGAAGDFGSAVDVDGTGAAYVAGSTSSTAATFPVTVGPDLSHNGGSDTFVAKVVPSGTSLAYAGYIGGAGSEFTNSLNVDETGSAYIAGETDSDQTTFPETVGPDLTHNGSDDAYVAKVAPSGAALVYAGYIGGAATDFGIGIAVDGSGAAYVTGHARSTETSFPIFGGPDTSHNGDGDAFVAKVAPSGASLAYAGFIGGSGDEWGVGVSLDASGAAYVAGKTSSSEATFPELVGPDLTFNGDPDGDAFVAKVSPSGGSLVYAGYVGGGAYDYGEAIAVDGSGAAYVTGGTFSSEATFPVAVGPDLSSNGDRDAFVAKVEPDGSALSYSGFIGGTGEEDGRGIAVDAIGNAYVVGATFSTEATFPESVGPDTSQNGVQDVFVAKVETTAATCQGKLVTAMGTQGNDTLTGTSGSDVVLALGGRDTVRSKAGRDRVCAGSGNDLVKGGGGNDRLLGEQGRDTLNGGAGKRDVCRGGPGKDKGGKGCEKGRL